MYFEFYQWDSKPNVHSTDDSTVKAMRGENVDLLLSHWMRWRKEFPSALKLVTLTQDAHSIVGCIQLRFWFGEPRMIRRGYVDSCGHNLTVHINTLPDELALCRLLRTHMVGDLPFTEEEVDGVEVWRIAEIAPVVLPPT